MDITEITAGRTLKLNKTVLPQTELPLGLKILWIESMDKQGMSNEFVRQPHQHTFYEIHFVFNGSISYECNNTLYKLNKGEAVIIPAFANHHYVTCSKDIFKTAIAFSADESILKTIDISVINFDDGVYENFNNILIQTDKDNVFTSHIISGRTLEILYSVFEKLISVLPKDTSNLKDPRFLVAKTFIENNYNKNLSCTEVANECCLSTKQLNRIFKKETEKSVSEYINFTKIKLAKKLLLNKQFSVKEVCFELGFENESSFISFFKRHSGLTPGVFRKQMSEK